MNARELALDIFLEMEKTGNFADTLIRNVLDKYDYEDPREKAFFKRLAEGTLERRITLDWAINCFSKTKTDRMKPFIRNLLRLSAYQILYMEGVPDSAACNEAVKLAKKRGFSSLSGFVNGVLRALVRGKNALPWPDEKKEPVRAISVSDGLPEWMVSMWISLYGERACRQIAGGLTQKRPVILRFRKDLTAQQLQAEMKAFSEAGVTCTPHPLYEGAYALGDCEGVAALPGFAEGLFYAQDVSSMLAVQAAGIEPGMRVIDLCSAPGGKAELAWEYMEGRGSLLAGDVSDSKADKIQENMARMGCEQVETKVWDAAKQMPELIGFADVVLADVPCSGLGVMGRKKDIRYRVKPEDIKALVLLQKEILTASWQYVKPGGVLLYSTCTVNRAENEEMVRFLTENFPFETESLNPYLPECLWNEETEKGCLQLLPGQHNTDGFFLARLRRRAD